MQINAEHVEAADKVAKVTDLEVSKLWDRIKSLPTESFDNSFASLRAIVKLGQQAQDILKLKECNQALMDLGKK